jgi:cysteine-S-conjugate beta-lyase
MLPEAPTRDEEAAVSRTLRLDRRGFLKSAGVSALLGAVGAERVEAAGLGRTALAPPRFFREPFDFDASFDRVGTDCSKWDGPIAEFGRIDVGMGIADMDFPAPPCVTRALAERCAHENWGYLRMPDTYVEAIVDWNQRRYGLVIDPATIELTTGVHPALISAMHAFVPPGSRVLLTTPVYSGFYGDIRFARTVAEESPMRLVDGRYQIDFDDFERRARRANAFILCNPQNPTGNVWSPEDLTRLGEICLEHRVVVLADEIHCDFVTSGNRYTPFASLPRRDIVDNSITFKAASKTFSLSAMKAAWYFSTNADLLARIRAHTRADLTTLGVVANEAALREGDDWLDQLVPYLEANHDLVESYVRENIPLLRYRKAEGTYLAWLDVSRLAERVGAEAMAAEERARTGNERTAEQVMQRWIAENAGVYLSPGSSYGAGGGGRMRMNLATQRANVRRALENIAQAAAAA